MCGIIGYITKETTRGANDRRKFFEQALIIDMVRGDDSTGVFGVAHDSKIGSQPDWVKLAGDPLQLMATKEYATRFGAYATFTDMRAMVGHNRSATVGTIDNDNAHPFQEGPITLVHNGTLVSTYHMPKSIYDLKSDGVEVDSHVIAHNLAEHDDPKEVISLLDGAFVLIWHDSRDDSLRIVRNEKRPLHMMWAKCEDTILFASEGEMLYWLAKRNNFSPGPIVTPKPMQLLTFRPGELTPEVEEVPPYVPKYSYGARSSTWGSKSYYRGVRATDPTPPWTSSSSKPTPAMEKALADEGLNGSMRIRFIPTLIREVRGRGTAIVSGTAYTPEGEPMPALITGLLHHAVLDAIRNNETWSVRPVGIRKLDDGDVSVMLGKLWARQYDAAAAEQQNRSAQVVEAVSRSAVPRIGRRLLDEYVPGPRDEYIPVREWLNLTADGCVQCGVEIVADDADDVEWVVGQSRPICPDCVIDNHRLTYLM